MELESNNHSVFLMHYHLVLVVKYRRRVVTVGRLFPSSQLCHECGYRFSGTKDLSVREWTCPLCGRTHDRDVNAARNIRDEGMRLALSA